MRVIHCYLPCLEPGAKTLIQPVIAQFIHSRFPLTPFLFLASSFLTPLVPHFMIVSAPVRKERDSVFGPSAEMSASDNFNSCEL